MRADTDLMDQLAAADPLRDGERLDATAQREADALLVRLLAEPPAAEPARARRRGPLVAAAAATCIAAVAFVAFGLAGSGAPEAVAARSAAALAQDDSVFHVVQRKRGVGNVEGATVGPFVLESWFASDGRFHERAYEDVEGGRGRLLEDTAGVRPPSGGVGSVLRYVAAEDRLIAEGIGRGAAAAGLPHLDPAADPGATLRALEERGALEAAGRAPGGYRIVSEENSGEDGVQRFEYVVDEDTYLPRSQRWTVTRDGTTLGFETEFLVYERLPLDGGTRPLLDLDPHAGASCARGADQPSGRDLGYANPCR